MPKIYLTSSFFTITYYFKQKGSVFEPSLFCFIVLFTFYNVCAHNVTFDSNIVNEGYYTVLVDVCSY